MPKIPHLDFAAWGKSNGDFRYIGGWDLGTQPCELPFGLRWFIPKGADLVVQIHYHPSGKETKDQSSVGFHYSKEPTSHPWTIIPVPPHFGVMQGIDIPAGAKEHIEQTSFTIPEDCEVFSVNAHAHYLGKRMEMTATFKDGSTKWLLKTSNWDFQWQEDYTFKQPIKLPAGTRLDVLMSYDNSAENPHNPTHPPKRVTWGPTTTDEMGVITLSAIFQTKEQKDATHQALRIYLANQLIDRLMEGDESVFGSVQGQIGGKDQNGKALKSFEAARLPLLALDTDKDGKLTPENACPPSPSFSKAPSLRGLVPLVLINQRSGDSRAMPSHHATP